MQVASAKSKQLSSGFQQPLIDASSSKVSCSDQGSQRATDPQEKG